MARSCILVTFLLIIGASGMAQTPPAPYAVGYSTTSADYQIVWHYAGVNTTPHANDINMPARYYLNAPPNGGGRVLVEFDSVNANAAVDHVEVFIWGRDPTQGEWGTPDSPFEIAIFDHPPSTVTDAALWGPHIVFAENVPSAGAWFAFPVHDRLDNVGKLFVQFRWLPLTPKAPLPALDLSVGNPHTYRGYVSGTSVIWSPEYAGNVLLRLFCNVADTLPGFEHPANAARFIRSVSWAKIAFRRPP